MDSSEKPEITTGTRPTVSKADSGPGAIAQHKDDIFFAAVETTRMPMLVTDPWQPDNPIIFANRAFESMTGYAGDEIIGQNCRFLQGPGTDPAAVSAIRAAVAAEEEITIELLNYRKNKTSFWNALYISPIRDESGRIVYFFASQLDVSRRKDAETSLAQAQRLESLGQLTGGIAHDFNNLLQVMSGHLDLLELQLKRKGGETAGVTRSVASVRAAVGKAGNLTSQLLAFARKQQLQGRTINLNQTAKGLVSMVRGTIGDGVRLRLELDEGLPNCRLDPGQLEVALLNVIVNARDAMPQGGSIRLRTSSVTVAEDDRSSFNGLRPGRYACMAVTDEGVGIAPELLGHVMEPFFTTKDEGRGTGLGLATVYGFAKQSGGTVIIYSEVGIGTTVRLYFPVEEAAYQAPDKPRPSPQAKGGSEIILLVDDRPEVADVARAMLENLGYQVVTAEGGRQALTLAQNMPSDRRPRLLFTDIIMPGGMNGVMLAREMLALLPDIKVLLTTGYAGDANEASGGEVPRPDFPVLKKPYGLADLAGAVRQALDGAWQAVPPGDG